MPMDICKIEELANALCLKVEGGKRRGIGHQLPHSPNKTIKQQHFHLTPIFCEVVVIYPVRADLFRGSNVICILSEKYLYSERPKHITEQSL